MEVNEISFENLPKAVKTKTLIQILMEKGKAQSLREMISTNQQFFQILQKNAQEIVAHEKEKIRKLRLPLPLAYADFRSLFCEFGTICLHNRNQAKDFVIDKDNEPIIEQLYCYMTNDSAFSGDLNKGIMLQGKYGCGKTILLEWKHIHCFTIIFREDFF